MQTQVWCQFPLLFDCITERGMFRFLDKHWRIKGWEDTNRGKPVPWHVYPKVGGYEHSSRVTAMPTADSGAQGALRKCGLNEARLCYDPIPRGPIKNQGPSCQLTKPEFFMEMESWGGNSYTGEKWDQKTSKTLPNQPLKTNLTGDQSLVEVLTDFFEY